MQTIVDLPELEILDGMAERKMSPKRPHARVQGAIYRLLWDVAEQFGELNIEWRCRPGAVDGSDTVLVPDLAYVERSRLEALPPVQRDVPPLAPDLVVEVRSPGENERRRDAKIEKYLALGTLLVLDVDPLTRTIRAISPSGFATFVAGDVLKHAALPWLSLPVSRAFEDLDR